MAGIKELMKGDWLVIIKPNQPIIKSGIIVHPSLEELQSIVEGYIEVIPRFNSFFGRECIAYCNEDGKMRNLEFNKLATNIWWLMGGGMGSHLVGTIAVVIGNARVE